MCSKINDGITYHPYLLYSLNIHTNKHVPKVTINAHFTPLHHSPPAHHIIYVTCDHFAIATDVYSRQIIQNRSALIVVGLAATQGWFAHIFATLFDGHLYDSLVIKWNLCGTYLSISMYWFKGSLSLCSKKETLRKWNWDTYLSSKGGSILRTMFFSKTWLHSNFFRNFFFMVSKAFNVSTLCILGCRPWPPLCVCGMDNVTWLCCLSLPVSYPFYRCPCLCPTGFSRLCRYGSACFSRFCPRLSSALQFLLQILQQSLALWGIQTHDITAPETEGGTSTGTRPSSSSWQTQRCPCPCPWTVSLNRQSFPKDSCTPDRTHSSACTSCVAWHSAQ